MVNGSKRVVLRKPKLDMDKQIDVRPREPEPLKKSNQGQKKKTISETKKPEPTPKDTIITEPLQEKEIDIDIQQVLKTSSPHKTIIVKKEPVNIKSSKTVIYEDPKTFDEKFLDSLDIKSRITKDVKTQERLKKPELKPTIKPKTKEKRKLNPYILISLIAFVILTVWVYKVIKDFIADKLDGSLASFVYLISNVILLIMTFIWFIIESVKRDAQ